LVLKCQANFAGPQTGCSLLRPRLLLGSYGLPTMSYTYSVKSF